MDKMYVLDMLSDILALILGEDTEGAKAICRNEMKKIEIDTSHEDLSISKISY